MGVIRAGRTNAGGHRLRKRKALMLTLVSQIVGQKNAGLNFKPIIKCARIFRGTKSLNFEIFLYTVSIGRKIPSGVIASPRQESKRALSKPYGSASAIDYDIGAGRRIGF